jgi:signal transduction histidine kinase
VAWAGAAVFVATFPLLYRYPRADLALLSGLAAVAMASVAPGNAPLVAEIAVIALAASRLDREQSRWIAGLTGGAFLAVTAFGPHHLPGADATSMAPGLLFTYIAAASVRQLRAEQQRIAELLDEVIAGRDARIQAAALEERARLAREMHDVLAHTLSALSVQLEGAKLQMEQRDGDPSALAAVERASRLAKEGLAEARRAVGSLRGDSLPGPDLLPGLVEDFQRDTGVPTSLRIEGSPADLPPDARLSLYRTAQEALTNVRKHADATRVEIRLHYAPGAAELTVENWGTPRPPAAPGGGFGLVGMRERAELLGGTLEAAPTDTGFRVRLRVPA